MTYVIAEPCVTCSTRRASKSAPSTASTRASACSTSTRTSASTAAPGAGVPGRGDLLRGRHARPVEGLLQGQRRVLRRPGLARAAPPRSARSTRTTRSWPRCRRRTQRGSPRGTLTRRARHDRRRLPDFPWDRSAGRLTAAAAHPDGIVDLSVGTPVDPTPAVIRAALTAAADAPGYPTPPARRRARRPSAAWLRRRCGVAELDPVAVLPTIGSKELVAWLPTLLGLGPGDTVGIPSLAYPTYDVGARLAGAQVSRVDDADRARSGRASTCSG